MPWAAIGTDSDATRTEAGRVMQRFVLWVGPPVAVVIGVALWFILVPGRSGAG